MEFKIELDSDTRHLELFGPSDKHLRMIRTEMDVHVSARDREIIISGKNKDVRQAADTLDKMDVVLKKHGSLSEKDVLLCIEQAKKQIKPKNKNRIEVFSPKRSIEPTTAGQQHYVELMLKNDLTFCIGPAGTGKTYLAVAVAVSMLKSRKIRKIVLARPAVEAGEKLGFLPGDLREKVNPYLRPLFDSLEDMMEFSQMRKFMEIDIIEVVPLAFMRGRTLNEAVVICDEAQNTLPSQMLMFLTRMGRGSKMIITGDITQVDLERGQSSGLIDAISTLRGIDGIGVAELNEGDIVRHNLVQNIVQAYDKRKKLT